MYRYHCNVLCDGFRLNTLSDNVTHVVIGERLEKDLEMLRNAVNR